MTRTTFSDLTCLCICVAFLFAGGGCNDSAKQSAAKNRFQSQIEFRAAVKAFNAADYDKAQRHLNESIALNKENSEALIFLGHTLRQTGQPDSALEAYQSVSAKDRKNRLLASGFEADTLLYDLGNSVRAETGVREVLASDPDHGMGNQGLGLMMQIQGRVHESPP